MAKPYAPGMFMVTNEEAAAIRAAYQERGEWAAVVELRRLFPAIQDNAEALRWARVIAGWRSPADASSGVQ